MILDDLLIYGDWLEENDIKNGLYKQFLNYLRIKLRRNNEFIISYSDPNSRFWDDSFENGSGNGCGYCAIGGYFSYINGAGCGYGLIYGYDTGDGVYNLMNIGDIFGKYGYKNGDGRSI